MEEVAGSKGQGASVESEALVKRVSEDEIRHGFDEPLTAAGEGYEWAWVGMSSSYKGWWVAVKEGCTPFAVAGFSLAQITDGTLDKWQDIQTRILDRTVVQVGEWWVAVKCDG